MVNDTHFYQLNEQEPLVLEEHELPIKLFAKNGFHFSKPFYIKNHNAGTILIDVGCEADNGRFWGGIVFSLLLFTVYMVTGFYIVLLLANLPLLYLVYKFFIKTNEFITLEILKP